MRVVIDKLLSILVSFLLIGFLPRKFCHAFFAIHFLTAIGAEVECGSVGIVMAGGTDDVSTPDDPFLAVGLFIFRRTELFDVFLQETSFLSVFFL